MKRSLLHCLTLLACCPAFAGGNADTALYNAGFGGHVIPLHAKDSALYEGIRLESEIVRVRLHPGLAVVKAEYRFSNRTERDILLEVGLPSGGEVEAPIVGQVRFGDVYGLKVLSDGNTVRTDSTGYARSNVESGRYAGFHAWMQAFAAKQQTVVTLYYITRNHFSKLIRGDRSADGNAFGYDMQAGRVWGGTIGAGQVLVEMGEGLHLTDVRGLLPGKTLTGDMSHLRYGFSDLEPGPDAGLLIWYEGAAPDFPFEKKALPFTDTLLRSMDAFPDAAFAGLSGDAISRRNFSVSASGLTLSGILYFLMFLIPWVILAVLIVYLLGRRKKAAGEG